MTVDTYLTGIEQIYREQPAYKLGHDGSDGLCDCIGMCKGAIKRGGESPTGLQGTNYAARYTIRDVHPIHSAAELRPGDVVLKGREPSAAGYDLPERYRAGGRDYNGDLTDYYHIGTVTRVDPLEITHMTTPTAKKDTKLGKWAFVGQLPQIQRGGGGDTEKGIVTAAIGSTVNLRKQPAISAALIERVPVGTEVDIISTSGEWSNVIVYGTAGWMMSRFITKETPPEPGPEPGEPVTITLSAEEAAAALPALQRICEEIVRKVGRG